VREREREREREEDFERFVPLVSSSANLQVVQDTSEEAP
jgi:hypothetical protein